MTYLLFILFTIFFPFHFIVGKTLILKERAIQAAKKRIVKVEVEMEEYSKYDVTCEADVTNIEEDALFLTGFGNLYVEDEASFVIDNPEDNQGRNERKRKKKEEKQGKARKALKIGLKGKLIVLSVLLRMRFYNYYRNHF